MDKLTIPVVCLLVISIIAFSISTMAFFKNDYESYIEDLELEIQYLTDKFEEQEDFNDQQLQFNLYVADYVDINTELWETQVELNGDILYLLGIQ